MLDLIWAAAGPISDIGGRMMPFSTDRDGVVGRSISDVGGETAFMRFG